MINLGTNEINKIYNGSNEIQSIYLGTQEVYAAHFKKLLDLEGEPTAMCINGTHVYIATRIAHTLSEASYGSFTRYQLNLYEIHVFNGKYITHNLIYNHATLDYGNIVNNQSVDGEHGLEYIIKIDYYDVDNALICFGSQTSFFGYSFSSGTITHHNYIRRGNCFVATANSYGQQLLISYVINDGGTTQYCLGGFDYFNDVSTSIGGSYSSNYLYTGIYYDRDIGSTSQYHLIGDNVHNTVIVTLSWSQSTGSIITLTLGTANSTSFKGFYPNSNYFRDDNDVYGITYISPYNKIVKNTLEGSTQTFETLGDYSTQIGRYVVGGYITAIQNTNKAYLLLGSSLRVSKTLDTSKICQNNLLIENDRSFVNKPLSIICGYNTVGNTKNYIVYSCRF